MKGTYREEGRDEDREGRGEEGSEDVEGGRHVDRLLLLSPPLRDREADIGEEE